MFYDWILKWLKYRIHVLCNELYSFYAHFENAVILNILIFTHRPGNSHASQSVLTLDNMCLVCVCVWLVMLACTLYMFSQGPQIKRFNLYKVSIDYDQQIYVVFERKTGKKKNKFLKKNVHKPQLNWTFSVSIFFDLTNRAHHHAGSHKLLRCARQANNIIRNIYLKMDAGPPIWALRHQQLHVYATKWIF